MAEKQTWERKIIEAGYRDLAKRCHPDKGGAPEDMAALNAAVSNLRAVEQYNATAARRPVHQAPAPPAGVAQGVYVPPIPGVDASAIFDFVRDIKEILFGQPQPVKRRRKRAR
jgi:hypothetical protein